MSDGKKLVGSIDFGTRIYSADEVDSLVAGKFPIGSQDIADGAVTNAKLGGESVSAEKIRANAISFEKLDSDSVLGAVDDSADKLVTSAAVKDYVDGKVASVYKFMGSVQTYADLPSSGNVSGHVYDVADTGDNYAWVDGTGGSAGRWDKLGPNMSGYVPSTRTVNGKALSGNVEITAEDVPDGGSSVKARLDGVDDALAGRVSKAGDTMSGALMFDSQGAATAQFQTYDEDTGESPTLTLAFDCDPLSGESGAVSASGEFAASGYDYATEQTVWRRFRLANAHYESDSPGYGYVEADIVDASTGVVVAENYYAWLSIYDYGDDYGYVEAIMSVSFDVDGTQYEPSLYGELTSRTPSLSGRAVTTPELEAVGAKADSAQSTASSAYSAANSKATMTQVNNAISTHNTNAAAHSTAIANAVGASVSTAIQQHDENLNAHVASLYGEYHANADATTAYRGAYLFGDAGNPTPDYFGRDSVRNLVVRETSDSAAYQEHGGNFVLYMQSGIMRQAQNADGRTYHVLVYMRDTRDTTGGFYNEPPIKTIAVRSYSDTVVFDASHINRTRGVVVAVSMDVTFFASEEHNYRKPHVSNIRTWRTSSASVGAGKTATSDAATRDLSLYHVATEAGDGVVTATLTIPNARWIVATSHVMPVLDVSALLPGETAVAYVKRGDTSTTPPASTFESIRVAHGTYTKDVGIGALLPDAVYGTYRDWWRIAIQMDNDGQYFSVGVEKSVGRGGVSYPGATFRAYDPDSPDASRVVAALPSVQSKFDAAVAGTATVDDVRDLVVAMYRSMGFSATPAQSNA